SVKVAPGAIIPVDCELRGEITIGSRTVIHPKARIIAEAGPIIIGESNLIEEQAEILNFYLYQPIRNSASRETPPQNQTVMIIGNQNVFEVSSKCEALNVGDNNIIECKASVGRNVELSNGCIVGPMCSITTVERLPENTVIYGANCDRRTQLERPPPQTAQLDFLMKILPNYHHIRKHARPPPK
ncbi:hypothetical protein HELRODRAFT_78909, partial [Helobdella robusta]|uniref:Dynactin subunit 6 n=1 Tax=Helobdella robusta TaxID=6412 RepID=T1G3H2_HELRO